VNVRVAVLDRRAVDADPARLTAAERDALAPICGDRRRDEWIRGRLAIRAVLGDPDTSVLVRADGAPLPTGGQPCSVSLSHDGEWIAVAVGAAEVRIGIDLCVRSHEARVARIVRWLDVRCDGVDPLTTWTALEAALKLRGLGVEALRDRALEVEPDASGVLVCGLGNAMHVRSRSCRDYVLGCAMEAA
jgi:hypothetical protein